ncbi:MAG: hypothetical protein U5R31_14875 [Acidimicrobiia bacterium]|nr:hypothetical protein [Acidimicrobiia bacterium]
MEEAVPLLTRQDFLAQTEPLDEERSSGVEEIHRWMAPGAPWSARDLNPPSHAPVGEDRLRSPGRPWVIQRRPRGARRSLERR